MDLEPTSDVYSPREIAEAAGVSDEDAIAAVGRADALVSWQEAVRVARALAHRRRLTPLAPNPLLATDRGPQPARGRLPLVVSSTVHVAALAAVILIAGMGLAPHAAALSSAADASERMRLVFIATPGPGGGGGGGGLLQKPAPPKARAEGRHTISSPLPRRDPPKPIAPRPMPPEPKPTPIQAERLPVVVAPVISAPADPRTRPGVMVETAAKDDSRGSGRGGGAGTGNGTGLGEGDGSGIGAGSGGGTGGGPYRPGSGIEPPRLLREVKADYTEDARRRGVEGDVVMEIVVRRDGTVGDVHVLRGLDSGLNDRAINAVRQWQFTAARRQGAPVDVIVEVAVEFKLR